MESTLKHINERETVPEQHLATGAYKLYRPRYVYQPRTAGLPVVAIIDIGCYCSDPGLSCIARQQECRDS